MEYGKKLKKLRDYVKNLKRVLVAFSGGVDSTFLAKVAYEELGEDMLAVTISTPLHPKREIEESKKLAKVLGFPHLVVRYEEVLEIEEFKSNPLNRCYVCKKNLFSKLKDIAEERGFYYIVEGTNADDINDFRPGRKALKELGILSPLLDCGITKEEIRLFSKEMDLPTWNKPSYACLASRIPYGEEITYEKLSMVEKAEESLKSLGFDGFRVRYHGDVARIELRKEDMERVFEEDIRKKIVEGVKEAGFKYVALDLEGYRTGSLNPKRR
ncbi:ATP-dependent sacrificial sulfur transferase LarE [Caldanaerobacter subterraneus]|uniref:ATP-dependent sacrificial sulfur transferase LarE n=1 Tax=Caldanaerobacter subterraneus TaxID=911092 RepID=UPI0005C707B3|nr:ATP-dependent sacrificial sulfur transferase LarE [Caldanaerobacter subterraneus]